VHLAAAWEIAVRTNPMLLAKLKLEAFDRIRSHIHRNLERGVSADELRRDAIDHLFAAAASPQLEYTNEAKPSRE